MKKGPLAEAQVVQCLREHGWPHVERRVQGGARDRGDVAGLPGIMIEVKSQHAMTLSKWVDEADRQAQCGPPHYDGVAVVWHKRERKGDPLDWYVTMTGRDFLTLLAEYTREA